MLDNSTQLTCRFEEALVYATQLHAQQVRKVRGVPYISHLLSVAALVLEDGGDEDEAIAALLHDAIEDQGGAPTGMAIRQKFGHRVADIVEGCTETDVFPKPPWRRRKEMYLEHLRSASEEVRRVAIADKLHNARCVLADYERYGDLVWTQFHGGKEGTLWFYRSFVNQQDQKGFSYLTEELKRVVNELEKVSNYMLLR